MKGKAVKNNMNTLKPGNIKIEPMLMIVSYKSVAMIVTTTTSIKELFFLRKPPRKPMTPKPSAWNIVQMP